jgi:hypothetical protein
VPDAGPGSSYYWSPTNGATTIFPPFDRRTVTFGAGVSGNVGLSVTVFAGGCPNGSTISIPIVPASTALGALSPCRLVDTRLPNGPGGGPALSAGVIRNLALAGHCGIPADAVAVSLNVTVTAPTSMGALAVYAGGTSPPPTSNLNFGAGQTRAGSSIVMLGLDGSVDVFTTQPSGTVHVILDVNGYFR